MLTQSHGMTIVDVALDTGVTDQNHLTRHLKTSSASRRAPIDVKPTTPESLADRYGKLKQQPAEGSIDAWKK